MLVPVTVNKCYNRRAQRLNAAAGQQCPWLFWHGRICMHSVTFCAGQPCMQWVQGRPARSRSLNDICSRLLWIFRSWTRRWYKRGKKTSEWSLWRSLSSAPNCCPTSPSSSSIHPSSSSSPIFSIPSDDLFMIELSTRRLWWPVQRLAVPGTLPKYWLPTRWIYGRGLEVFYQQHSQHSLLGM